MINIYKIIICVFSIFCVTTGICHADELTRYSLDADRHAESIIRHYDSVTDVVCNHPYYGYPSFLLLKEGISIVNSIQIAADDVMDFEIYKDTVYFCGKIQSYQGDIALIGYFDMASFSTASNVQVYYLSLPWYLNCVPWKWQISQ